MKADKSLLSRDEWEVFQTITDKEVEKFGWNTLKHLDEEDSEKYDEEGEDGNSCQQAVEELFDDVWGLFTDKAKLDDKRMKEVEDTLSYEFYDYVINAMWNADVTMLPQRLDEADVKAYQDLLVLLKEEKKDIDKDDFEVSVDWYNTHIDNLSKNKGYEEELKKLFDVFYPYQDTFGKEHYYLEGYYFDYITLWVKEEIDAIGEQREHVKRSDIILIPDYKFPKTWIVKNSKDEEGNKIVKVKHKDNSDLMFNSSTGVKNEIFEVEIENSEGIDSVWVNVRGNNKEGDIEERIERQSEVTDNMEELENELRSWEQSADEYGWKWIGNKVVIGRGEMDIHIKKLYLYMKNGNAHYDWEYVKK